MSRLSHFMSHYGSCCKPNECAISLFISFYNLHNSKFCLTAQNLPDTMEEDVLSDVVPSNIVSRQVSYDTLSIHGGL